MRPLSACFRSLSLAALVPLTICDSRSVALADPPDAHKVPKTSTKEAAPPDAGAAAVDPKLYAQGKTLYAQHCTECHQSSGRGVPGAFPPLAGSPIVRDRNTFVEIIKKGVSGSITVAGHRYQSQMPPIGSSFSPAQVAAVATYVRNTFGNHDGGVSEEEVKRILSGGPSH